MRGDRPRNDETMGKYDRLQAHLRRQKAQSYTMGLTHIEGVIGAMLPKSALRPEWWSEGDDLSTCAVQCRAWLAAGYRASLLERREEVRFERCRPPRSADQGATEPSD